MLGVLNDRVAIIPLENPERSKGGIIIPNTAQHRVVQGVVVEIGIGVREIKRGMHVVFSGYAGTHIPVENEGIYYIMPEDAIAAVIYEFCDKCDVMLGMNGGKWSCPTCGSTVVRQDWIFSQRTLERLFDDMKMDIPEHDLGGRILMDGAKKHVCDRLRAHFFAEGVKF